MASKAVFSFLASVLLTQSAYGQCISNLAQPILTGSGSISTTAGLGFASNAPSYGSNGLNLNYELPGAFGSAGPLIVSSGSALTPNGLRILSENLELGGEVAVTGNYPFVTAVGLDGAIPSGGGASISYSSAPGVGLSNAGCGLGLSGAPGTAVTGNPVALGGRGNLVGGNYGGIPGRQNAGCGL